MYKFTCNYYSAVILDFGVTSHNVINQSMIINFEMKKIFGGEAKQNPPDSSGYLIIHWGEVSRNPLDLT
jgi:hypothetical protein